MREHTAAIKPPRGLWVPFILGRPFGVPGDSAFQRRVLIAVLRLLEAPAGPVLEDYAEEAPRPTAEETAGMACPVSFERAVDERDLGAALSREIEELSPWHDLAAKRRERTTTGLSGMTMDEAALFLASYLNAAPQPNLDGMSAGETLKIVCDDIRAYYYEAAAAKPGNPDAAAVLLIELDGQEQEVAAAVSLASELCRRAGARTIREARDAEQRALLWKGRKSAISALGRRFPNYYLQDGVVPRGSLPQVLAAIERLSASHGLPVANVFHAGDGNLHPLILYRAGEPGVGERVEALSAEILRLCIDAGGSITGEHGVGIDKRCYMDWMYSPDDLATMTLVRQAFDPAGLANPGKLFPTPAGCAESLRRRPEIPGAEGLEVF